MEKEKPKKEEKAPLKAYKTKNVSISGNEKIGLISNMTTMLTAGIPILETVDALLEDSKGNQKKFLETLRSDLMQGHQVNTTFAKFPKIFDKVTVNIVKAAEEAGTLDVTLKDIRENIRKDMDFTDKIKSALMYPIFIGVVFVGVLLMILIVVIPKISSVFLRMGVPLPLPTQILIAMSNALIKSPIITMLVLAGIITGLVMFFKTQKGLVIAFLSSLPLVSDLVKQIDLTRFTRSLYLLLNAGIPITTALELTEHVVNRKDIAKAVSHARETVSAGRKLSDAFKDSRKVMPSIVIRITEAGERSGSLDKAMLDGSEFLDYQVSKTLKTVTSLIEPLMLVTVGGMIGGMMLAIIAPIYSMIGSVGAK